MGGFDCRTIRRSRGRTADRSPSRYSRRFPLIGLLLAASVVPTGVQAQEPPRRAPPVLVVPEATLTPQADRQTIADRADRLFLSDPAQALILLDQALQEGPKDPYPLEWRAARSALVLGVLEEVDEVVELDWLLTAEAYADSALVRDAKGLDGLYWSAAVKGRLALQYGARTTARLAQEVWDLTHAILVVDPEHAGAHNILGKLNQEVMSLSGWQRMLGKLVLRYDPLKEASWDRALDHHRRAVAGDPTTVLFHMDLGRTLELTDDDQAARVHYEKALALPDGYPVDPRFKGLIRGYLAELPGG